MANSNYFVRVSGVKVSEAAVYAELKGAQTQDKVDAVADASLNMMRSLVPVLTGRLQRSLEKRKTPDGMGRQVGSFDVDYADDVEFGHQARNGKWVPAQPYIRPSLNAARGVMQRGN